MARRSALASTVGFSVGAASDRLESARRRLVRLSGRVENAAEDFAEPYAKDVEDHR